MYIYLDKSILLVFYLLALLFESVCGAVKLDKIFSDNIVLQAWDEGDVRTFINGKATPSSTISVTVKSISLENSSVYSMSYHALVDDQGEWAVPMDGTYKKDPSGHTGPHYGPYTIEILEEQDTSILPNDVSTLKIANENKVVLNNVTFGEVFVCVGDEHMDRKLEHYATPDLDTEKNIRIFDGEKWMTSFPVNKASALCQLTALQMRKLYTPLRNNNDKNYPIGLIIVTQKKSCLEDWTEGSEIYENRMRPLLSYLAFRSVIFSQGIADAMGKCTYKNEGDYSSTFKQLIKDWRQIGVIGDFSFVFTQIGKLKDNGTTCTFQNQSSAGLVNKVRISQTDALPTASSNIDTTGVATLLDLNILDFDDLREASKRIVYSILHTAFGKQEPFYPWSPPQLKDISSKILHDELKTIQIEVVLTFDNIPDSKIDKLKFQSSNTRLCNKFCEIGTIGLNSMLEIQIVFGEQAIGWIPASSLNLKENKVIGRYFLPENAHIEMKNINIDNIKAEMKLFVRYAFNDDPLCIIINENEVPLNPFVLTSGTVLISNHSRSSYIYQNENDIEASGRPFILESSFPESTVDDHFRPPLMGFNSWNIWHCWVSEELIKETADQMLKLGLVDAGYNTVIVDDCWQASRTYVKDTGLYNGTIVEDPVRFPSGFKDLSKTIHDKGLDIGVYTAQATYTCQNRPASYQHEELDAQTYCDYNIDYLKIDGCEGDHHPELNTSWILFRKALDQCSSSKKKSTWMSCSSCSDPNGCGKWIGKDVGCNSWRTTNDIEAQWSSIIYNVETNNRMASASSPGHYNDPDILQVGNVGLSLIEQKSHFSLWSIVTGPLLISTDLRKISKESLEILKTKEVIAVNQDRSGNQGILIKTDKNGNQIWSKKLFDDSYAVIFLNKDSKKDANITLEWNFLEKKICDTCLIRDLWKSIDIGIFVDKFTAENIPPHGVMMIKLSKKKNWQSIQ